MKEYYTSKSKKTPTREAIIGLGEDSFRKNYYPELQEKLLDLERINSRNRALITTIPDILFVSDIHGHIAPFSVSSRGSSPLALEIMRDRAVIKKMREIINQVVAERKLITHNFEIDWMGTHYYFEARLHISEFEEILIMIRDMSEQVMLEKQLRDMANIDSLTKLCNRRRFEVYLDEVNRQVIEDLTIVLVDIDGLKMVNDTLGHLAGDRIIVAASKIILKCFQEIGVVSRVGGDEFGIIIRGKKQEAIEERVEFLQKSVRTFNEKSEAIKISLSSGYSHHTDGVVNVAWIFQEADNNMYQNKLLKESSNKNNLVKTLMKALEAKDYITEGHADRMETLGTMLGVSLKLHQNQLDKIQLLTKFHDIGKVGIPDSILKKPDSLTADEWKVMRTHCSIGERIANESSELREISHLILKHHERWDGKGYPLGLAEKEIPIECRILSIVDTFDAMTNDRPYRRALPTEVAINEIVNGAGTQFDPELVMVFQSVIYQYVKE